MISVNLVDTHFGLADKILAIFAIFMAFPRVHCHGLHFFLFDKFYILANDIWDSCWWPFCHLVLNIFICLSECDKNIKIAILICKL